MMHWHREWMTVGVAAVVTFTAATTQAAEIRDVPRGFSFGVPEGYQASADAVGGSVYYAFERGRPGEGSYGVFSLAGLGGTIGRDDLDRPTVERAARGSVNGTGIELTHFDYRKTPWKTFELDLLVMRAANGEQRLVFLGVQVPLAKEAIQIHLMGPVDDEARLLSELGFVLASLDGTTNWLDDSERAERLGRGIGLLVGLGIAVPVGIAWRRRSRRRTIAGR